MAQGKTKTITTYHKNNAATTTNLTQTVELVVVNDQLVPDFRVDNPGVIIPLTFYSSSVI